MSGRGSGSMYVDWKSRVIVDSWRFCESARLPARRSVRWFAGVREIWGVN